MVMPKCDCGVDVECEYCELMQTRQDLDDARDLYRETEEKYAKEHSAHERTIRQAQTLISMHVGLREETLKANQNLQARVDTLCEVLRRLLEFAPSIDPNHTDLDYDTVSAYERAEAERAVVEAAREVLKEFSHD